MRSVALLGTVMILSALLCTCRDEQKLTTPSSEALKFYNEGVDHFQKFYYSEAKAAFERALQADSNFAMAIARLAMIHRRTENEAAANTVIARALQKSAHASTHEQMFIRMLDRWFHYRYDEAGAVADSVIALYPKDAEMYVLRGNIFENTRNFDAALDLYMKGAAADTSYALATMSLGYAYSSRGDFDKAIEAMEQYIRLVPNEADPRASLADIYMRVGRYDEAFEQYQKSLVLKPDYWYSITKLGDVYVVWGRLNDAEKQFDRAMSKMVMSDQVRASNLATKGVLNLLRAKYEETIRLCEQSLALDTANVRAAFISVRALLKQNKFEAANGIIDWIREEIARRNLAESMVMLEFHLLRARYFNSQNLFDAALASCDSAMEYGSEFTRSEVYHMQGDIYLNRCDYDAALDALEGALRYNSNAPDALLTLTKVYKATGDIRMTSSIGARLYDLWKNADPDFQRLLELKQLIGKPRGASPAGAS